MEVIVDPTFEQFSTERFRQAFEKTKASFLETQGEIVLVTEKYYDKALWMAEHAFHSHDPLSVSIGITWNDDIKEVWLNTFKEGLSFLTIDRTTGEPMCLRGTRLGKKGQTTDLDKLKPEPKTQSIIQFLQYCEQKAAFLERFPTVWYVHFFGLCTSPKYTRMGLATTIMEFTLAVFKNMKMYPLYIRGEANSNYSKLIYEKLNFQEISDMKYLDYKVDGKVVFDKTAPHTSSTTYAYIIKND